MRRWISVLDWLPHYRRAGLPGDVVAGLTGAAVLVPQPMAYAQIAHLPPVVGLYASVVPLLDSFVELGRHPGAETYPGNMIVRVEAALYFTNAEPLAKRLKDLEREHPGLHTIVLDASGVNHLDATADHQLRRLALRYRDRGIQLLLVNVDEDVRAVMDASGFTELVSADHFFPTDADALARLDAR